MEGAGSIPVRGTRVVAHSLCSKRLHAERASTHQGGGEQWCSSGLENRTICQDKGSIPSPPAIDHDIVLVNPGSIPGNVSYSKLPESGNGPSCYDERTERLQGFESLTYCKKKSTPGPKPAINESVTHLFCAWGQISQSFVLDCDCLDRVGSNQCFENTHISPKNVALCKQNLPFLSYCF